MRAALYTKCGTFTADSENIVGFMKLPNDSPITQSTRPHIEGGKSLEINTPSQAKPLPNKLSSVLNTWATVQHSQALPSSQNQQVLSQLALLTGQPNPSPNTGSGISEKLNLEKIAQTLNSSTPLPKHVQLVLVKLLTNKGNISVLSTASFKPGSDVFISQNQRNELILTPKQNTAQHPQFRNQFLPEHTTQKPIPLLDSHQITTQLKQTTSTSTPFTSTPNVLDSAKVIKPEHVLNAIKGSGQNFESNVAKLLKSASMLPAAPSAHSHPESKNEVIKKLNQVENQIQSWVQTFKQKVTSANQPRLHANEVAAPPTPHKASMLSLPIMDKILANTHLEPKFIASIKQEIAPLLTSIQTDQKSWMGQQQQHLLQQLTQQLTQKGERFIPNWSAQNLSNGGIQTFNQLNDWLDFLVKPKFHAEPPLNPLMKPASSAQAQLHQTLTLLANSFGTNEANSNELSLIRQLLNISQNIMKTSHDQLINRAWLQQGDGQNLQLSLPYLHQNHIQWCELEYQQPKQNKTQQQHGLQWHLILRFAQDTANAFAIESQMMQEMLGITLWADQQEQLQYLRDEAPIFRNKLTEAGFKLENLQTKHGTPAKLHQPLAQSLIDVHT